MLLATVLLPGFLVTRGGGLRRITILDQSQDPSLLQLIIKRTESGNQTTGSDDSGEGPASNTNFIIDSRAVSLGENISDLKQEYNTEIEKDADRAYIVLPQGVLDGQQPEYYARNVGDFSVNRLQQIVSSAISERRLQRAGLDPAKIAGYLEPSHLKITKVGPGGELKTGAENEFQIAFILLFFLYITVLFYGMFVMRGVLEEKQSRIVELLASSVTSTQMMAGKLLGIGLVGLTQVGIWALFAILITRGAGALFGLPARSIPYVPISLLGYFLLYFVLGYFLFSTLYAMVGAMVSSEEDAQQAQWPVTLLVIVPMMIFPAIVNNPNGPSSVLLAWVPFLTPTLMLLRIALINPPLWQILVSILIMLATIAGCTWVAARIYRVGILMYGKRPTLSELGRWIRQPG
jgi:ABC-2 type transport system permease protein